MDDIPRTIVRSIVRSDSYDILVPSNISTSPYIAISYSDDTEEEQSAFVSDTCPAQDLDFLTIPPPGATTTDCEEDDDSDGSCPDTVAGDLETSSCGFDELRNLESTTDLERYFSGCSDRFQTVGPLEKNSLTSVGPLSVSFESSDIPKLEDEALEMDEETDSSLKLYGSDSESDCTRFSDNE